MPDASTAAVPRTAANKAPAPSPAVAGAAEQKLLYRLFTGADDRAFCERVSAALTEGYVLHGGPAVTFNGSNVVVAQALVLPAAIANADAAVASAVDDLDFDGGGHA
ncbi:MULTISPECIES: DUF1737 domain-containing protein [Micrococcaceae]|uniref:DUF1737 domain-containing protein n=1 Tax=Micrococcaceae TaxID=1268 RepID=UPI0020970191|nr:DUF1737 domain-containing protein [Arthrobacter sp. H16F315]MDD1476346.1 DUF1737 domain-containing protein [Arthrobacter sp. H16F315]